MKKILFLIVTGIAILQISNAQVVELYGIGVHNDDPATLLIPGWDMVDHVVVEAAAIYDDQHADYVVPDVVNFTSGGLTKQASFQQTEQNLSIHVNGGRFTFGYFTAEFDAVDAAGIVLDKLGQGNNIKSLTAYVTKAGASGVYTEVIYDHAFLYRLGTGFPLVYDFTIPSSTEPRDINVSVPFSDLESNDLRPANVILSAGGGTYTTGEVQFLTNNEGDYLHIEPLTLIDVPGDVTDVKITIYSKSQAEATPEEGGEGDSFITGAVLLSTEVEEGGGCTLTQGYWKTHSEDGPASKPDATWDELINSQNTIFYSSGMSWIDLFNTPVGGNAYYNLAHQFMAAHLNMLAGASAPSEVQVAYDAAKAIFSGAGESATPGYYEKVKGKTDASKEEIQELISLAYTLTEYNEGVTGPGHCGEEYEIFESELEKSGNIARVKNVDFTVYPNPLRNTANISFVPRSSGMASVELYNSVGQRMGVLYHMNVRENIGVSAEIDVQDYKEGLYILRFRNNTDIVTKKIRISN